MRSPPRPKLAASTPRCSGKSAHRPRLSRCAGMIESAAGVAKRGFDVLGFEVRQFTEHLLMVEPRGEQVEDVDDPDSHPANAGTTSALFGVDGNAIEDVGHRAAPCYTA